jgi:large subunit ribosomal protein L30
MKLKITQNHCAIDRRFDQKQTIQALGLKRLHHTVVHNDTPQIRGMVFKVQHLLKVEEVKG